MTHAEKIYQLHCQMKQAGAPQNEYYRAARDAARELKRNDGYDPSGGYRDGKFYFTLADGSQIELDTYSCKIIN